MAVTFDAVAFFAEHAGRHLVDGDQADAGRIAEAVFGDAYPFGMPIDEYARRSLAQARRAGVRDARRILEALAQCRIVDAVIDGSLGDATEAERAVLVKARARRRRRAPARERPLRRRPAPGAVVLARVGRVPFTIANVRWGSARVEQRWMHRDSLEALVRRLIADPPTAPFILAVAGRHRFPASSLAFSTRDRFAVCHPERTERLDIARLRRLEERLAGQAPERRALLAFRTLCRERALAADTVPVDRALMRIADGWGHDANAMHGLVLPATDIELAVLAGAGAGG